MPRRSIYETVIGQATTTNGDQLDELAQFLIRHRSVVLSPGAARALVTTRSYTTTPLGNVFTRAVELGKDKTFCFVKLPPGLSVPEVLAFRHLTFDVRQMEAIRPHVYKSLSELPEYADKILVNVTGNTTQAGEVSDLPAFQADLVRDLLSRSYFSSDRTWISPAIAQYLSKVYTMSLSAAVAQVFDLTYADEIAIRTLFGFYFLQKMSDSESAASMLRTNAKTIGVGTPQQVDDILSMLREFLGGKENAPTSATGGVWANPSIDDICRATTKLGIARLIDPKGNPKIDRRLLYTRMNRLGPDIHTSAMAIEYPPYWAYLILLAASGRKIGLAFTLKKGDLQRTTVDFANDLMRASGFLNAI